MCFCSITEGKRNRGKQSSCALVWIGSTIQQLLKSYLMLSGFSYTTQTPNSQTSPVARSKQTLTAQRKAGSFVTRLSQRLFSGEQAGVSFVVQTHLSGGRAAVTPAVSLLTST